LEVALMLEQEASDEPLQIVRVEQFDSIREAMARLRKIRRMSIARRQRVVERLNPSWSAVAVDRRVPVTPTGAVAPRRVEEPVPDSSASSWLKPHRVPKKPDEDASGGVLAPIVCPTGPRSGSDAKGFPPET
jgi:hypothetical protein